MKIKNLLTGKSFKERPQIKDLERRSLEREQFALHGANEPPKPPISPVEAEPTAADLAAMI